MADPIDLSLEKLRLKDFAYVVAMADKPAPAAAEACRVTLPAFTAALAKVGELIGTPITDSKPLRLNEMGHRVAKLAREILGRMDVFMRGGDIGAGAPAAEDLGSNVQHRDASAISAADAPVRTAPAPRFSPPLERANRAFAEIGTIEWTLEGKRIGLPPALSCNSAFQELMASFGLEPRQPLNDHCPLWGVPALPDDVVDLHLEWFSCRSTRPSDLRTVEILSEDRFAFALVRDDDPLASRQAVTLADLKDRQWYVLPEAVYMLLPLSDAVDWLDPGETELLYDLDKAFAPAPTKNWVWVPRSIANCPPVGYRAIPLADVGEVASLAIVARPRLTAREGRDLESLAGALRELLSPGGK